MPADQIGAVASGSVEQLEDARTAHHAALREPDDLRRWPASRYWHACCVDNRQAFFLWIGAGCAASNAGEPDGDGRLLSEAGSLFEVEPPGWSRRSHFRSCRLVWATVALGNFLLGCLGLAPLRRQSEIER